MIGIDEAQFFGDLYDFCCEAADHDGKTVIVAGLDGDYLRYSSNIVSFFFFFLALINVIMLVRQMPKCNFTLPEHFMSLQWLLLALRCMPTER